MAAESSSGRPRGASPLARIALLDALPDLASCLTGDERSAVAPLLLPVLPVAQGSLAVADLLDGRPAFAVVVLEGLVVHRLTVGEEPGMRILAPGDLVVPPDGFGPALVASSSYVAKSPTRLALLGNEILAAVVRAPRILIGLQVAAADQTERLATQLVICQLPRVADRVLAMLWLLAESFGRVIPAGTSLPLSLTHETLGALVGARRPTVTLAVGELAKRGAVIHQDRGWLLLEPPATPPASAAQAERLSDEPQLLDDSPSEWAASEVSAPSLVDE